MRDADLPIPGPGGSINRQVGHDVTILVSVGLFRMGPEPSSPQGVLEGDAS